MAPAAIVGSKALEKGIAFHLKLGLFGISQETKENPRFAGVYVDRGKLLLSRT